jgi:hypothetical protein
MVTRTTTAVVRLSNRITLDSNMKIYTFIQLLGVLWKVYEIMT